MLNGTLTLHDIRDVEAFTAAIIHQSNTPYNEDTHAHLIAETWILSTRYNPTQGSRFSAWAKHTLEHRLIDHDRTHNGDLRYQTGRAQHAAHHEPLDGNKPLTLRRSSPDPDSATTLKRLDHQRRSQRTRHLHELRQRLYHRTTT